MLDLRPVSYTHLDVYKRQTYDVNNRRTASLTSYADYERYGIGGGAVCGAYTGLVVLDGGALLQSLSLIHISSAPTASGLPQAKAMRQPVML